MIMWCWEVPGLSCYLFRRNHDDLRKNHLAGPNSFPALLEPWLGKKIKHKGQTVTLVDIVGNQVRWGNGSVINLCHLNHEKDLRKYLGAEMHVLGVDEGTTFADSEYRFLRGRCRSPGLVLPLHYPVGFFPRILIGTNPGGIGHHWFKRGFVDAEPMTVRQMSPKQGGMRRIFIPAKLEDNPSMQKDDPDYDKRLEGLPEALARAMRHGDWNVVAGAYFEMWDERKHVLRPFKIPKHWTRFRSMDWGSARPFSVGWWAVSDGTAVYNDGVRKFRIPRNALIRYREWYGQPPDSEVDNVGMKLTTKELAEGIKAMTGGEEIAYTTADPSMWDSSRGPSLAEAMSDYGIMLSRADNKRTPGAEQVRYRMKYGLIFCFINCIHSRRTIPVLQHDEHKPEDVNTDQEDHAYDDWRYACMSRSVVTEGPREDVEPYGIEQGTIDDLWEDTPEPKRKRI